jgi:transposase
LVVQAVAQDQRLGLWWFRAGQAARTVAVKFFAMVACSGSVKVWAGRGQFFVVGGCAAQLPVKRCDGRR